jgi:hypothetical protein
MAALPRTARDLGRDRERYVARRLRIVVVEVIDHLLDAHRFRRRQHALGEIAADVRVRRAVDVDGEGGRVLVRRLHERLLFELCWFRNLGGKLIARESGDHATRHAAHDTADHSTDHSALHASRARGFGNRRWGTSRQRLIAGRSIAGGLFAGFLPWRLKTGHLLHLTRRQTERDQHGQGHDNIAFHGFLLVSRS